jgi:hypothetical protein
MNTLGIIAIIIVLFILFIVYGAIRDCQTGHGGLFSKICHIIS